VKDFFSLLVDPHVMLPMTDFAAISRRILGRFTQFSKRSQVEYNSRQTRESKKDSSLKQRMCHGVATKFD